jgi:hypothetical protein
VVGLSHRRALIEVTEPLAPHTNLMLRLAMATGGAESPEVYAKVMHPQDESDRHYVIHFTFVPPGLRAQLHRLVDTDKTP